MKLRLQLHTDKINRNEVSQTLQSVGMAFHPAEKEQKLFENSQAVVFIFEEETLLGFGRAISDRVCQAALYDVAVKPDHQGKGIGRIIIESLPSQLPGCNFILYASPGKEDFYRKLGLSKMKTGMALFTDADRKRERGFIE